MIFFVLICILIGSMLSLVFGTAGILVVSILGMLILLIVSCRVDDKIYYHFAIIFVILTIAVLVLYFGYIDMYGYPYMGGWNNDDSNFDNARDFIASKGYLFPWQIKDIYVVGANNSKGYIIMLSWLVYITKWAGGYHTIMPRLLNIYFLLIIGVLVYKYIYKYYKTDIRSNIYGLYAVTLFPNSIYISAHIFRDTLISLIMFSVFYVCDKYFVLAGMNQIKCLNDRKYVDSIAKIKSYLYCVIFIVIIGYFAYTIRMESMYFIMIIVIVSVFIKNYQLSIKTIWIYFSVLVIVLYLFYQTGFIEKLISVYSFYADYRMNDNTGLSQNVFGIPILPTGIFFRIGYALITPIPIPIMKIPIMFTNVETLFEVLCSIGTIIQFILLPYLFRSLRRIDKVSIVFWMILIAIAVTTFTFRHFIMLYPYMVILIFRELQESTPRMRIQLFVFMLLTLFLLTTIYLFLKY